MGSRNILEKLLDFIWYDRISAIEYFFAKRWLDKTFGKQEYWGDFIAEGIVARPKVTLFTRKGERLITKIKHRDFN